MELHHARAISDAAVVIGHDELDLREDYSGRGMYGSTTAALVGSFANFVACAAYAAHELESNDEGDIDSFVDDLMGIRMDAMGRNTVFY